MGINQRANEQLQTGPVSSITRRIRQMWSGMTRRDRIHCKEFTAQLEDYVDRELSPHQLDLLDEHACVCVRCNIRSRSARKSIDVIRTKLDGVEAPSQLRAEIAGSIRSEAEKP